MTPPCRQRGRPRHCARSNVGPTQVSCRGGYCRRPVRHRRGTWPSRVLSESNDRVETLGQLPHPVAAYTELQDDSLQLAAQLQYRQQLVTPCTVTSVDSQGECGLETGTCFVDWVPGCATPHLHPNAALVLEADSTVETILSMLASASNVANLGFTPPVTARCY
jgi:hypothetical protein